ncbi:cation diffusion facilitator family transporter [Salipaludibacillus daqingensis]|uniref:cation diffusion facilitator family transporter n=1 Tax=Salipaludibacillus daqingensis TaxID=3041001 RepID=UPI0024767B82|nr:cation diffusion facilitator family transporter [Salipaludibacillus daqingensis]
MEYDHSLEDRLLKFSVMGALFFAAGGVTLGLIASSQMILFDGLYSFISVLLSGMSFVAAKFIRKHDMRRFPYGKDMLEPIVIMFKYFMIGVISIAAMISAISDLISGGREVSVGIALGYAAISTIACFFVFKYLRRKQTSSSSDFVKAEANQWYMDMLLSAGVLGGFLIAFALVFTPFDYIIPYVDPVMVLLVSIYFLKVPLSEMFKNGREIIGMAPDHSLVQMIEEAVESLEEKYHIHESITRVQKVGSGIFIEVDFIVEDDISQPINKISEQDRVREELDLLLSKIPYNKWLTVSFTADKKWAV